MVFQLVPTQYAMLRFFTLQEAIRQEQRARRRRRLLLREELDLVRLPDQEFVTNYRLNKILFEELCEEIVPLLPPKTNRQGIDPVHKVFKYIK